MFAVRSSSPFFEKVWGSCSLAWKSTCDAIVRFVSSIFHFLGSLIPLKVRRFFSRAPQVDLQKEVDRLQGDLEKTTRELEEALTNLVRIERAFEQERGLREDLEQSLIQAMAMLRERASKV